MRRRLRLLWVTPNLPRRGVAAARERVWALLARLAPRHDVSVLALVDPEDQGAPDSVLPPGLAAVHRVPKEPFAPDDPLALLPRTVRWGYAHPRYRAALAERLASGRYDLVQLEYDELAYLAPQPSVPTILTVYQLGFGTALREWRARGGGAVDGALGLYRWLRVLDFELRAMSCAHHVVTMSAEDAARLRRFHPELRVTVSPVGVDCAYFRPETPAPAPEVDLAFVGHFEHPPNPDAATFLVRDVLPRLGCPARVRIIGQGVTPAVAALARPDVVEIAGAVPDVRPHLAHAAVVAAPVRFGTGMRGKVVEALAMGRPVVTTSVGAEGLGATSGQHLLIADGAADFAAAVRGLLDDPARAARLGAAGRAFVEARFDWDPIADAHDALYADVVRDPGTPPALPADHAPALARLVRGRPAVVAGAALLAARAVGWHLRRAPVQGATPLATPVAERARA